MVCVNSSSWIRFLSLSYHRVVAISQVVAREMGGRYFSNVDDFCEQHPDVVLLATSILSFQDIVKGLPVQRLRRSTLFVDVRDQVLVGSVTRCCCCSLLLLLVDARLTPSFSFSSPLSQVLSVKVWV